MLKDGPSLEGKKIFVGQAAGLQVADPAHSFLPEHGTNCR